MLFLTEKVEMIEWKSSLSVWRGRVGNLNFCFEGIQSWLGEIKSKVVEADMTFTPFGCRCLWPWLGGNRSKGQPKVGGLLSQSSDHYTTFSHCAHILFAIWTLFQRQNILTILEQVITYSSAVRSTVKLTNHPDSTNHFSFWSLVYLQATFP